VSSQSIRANGLIVLDPSDQPVLTFDWDTEALPAGVEIASNTFTITAVKQSGNTALTKDSETIPAGNRTTRLRLLATTATTGDRYLVASKIVTNESPAQTIERQFSVLIQNR
jgi:hypothetical protein